MALQSATIFRRRCLLPEPPDAPPLGVSAPAWPAACCPAEELLGGDMTEAVPWRDGFEEFVPTDMVSLTAREGGNAR